MERRSFLRALLTGVVGTVVSAEFDIDKLLWVPGAKTFFLPPVSCNTLLTDSWVSREVFKCFSERLQRLDRFYQQMDEEWQQNARGENVQPGTTIRVKLPKRYGSLHVVSEAAAPLPVQGEMVGWAGAVEPQTSALLPVSSGVGGFAEDHETGIRIRLIQAFDQS